MPEQVTSYARETQNLVQFVGFTLGDEEFAVRIGDVREIIRAGAIAPVPDAPPFVRGVSNIRGEIAAVIDLRTRFSLRLKAEAVSKYIIITEQSKSLFGLMIDELTEVLRVPMPDVKKAPEVVTKTHGEYVTGVIARDERLIILLDLIKVLSEGELEKLTEVTRALGASQKSAQRADPKPKTKKPSNAEDEDIDEG
jgi:purine-binding chemotaxis protein CheW